MWLANFYTMHTLMDFFLNHYFFNSCMTDM